ncbi:MAG: tRNA (guanine-N(1)-)-methyltransferase [Candidatus Omnitrophica bacterium ADurb.Bin277]|nr:MAG: tRNA (guanine-N(1)-)-methyltransferase [Candidatus Omnitrophica bacterium ADurb.Bin277]
MLSIDIVTLFPGFFKSSLAESLLKKAQERNLVKIQARNLRDWTHDRHKTADDKPFGGGPGMVLKPEPLFECVEAIRRRGTCVVLMDPQGEPMTQALARELVKKKHLIVIAGHYEGVDQRVKDHLIDREISIGDFITMGGEAPALCLIEALVRLVPGALGNKDSAEHESFENGMLEHPHYTRPREYRGWKVPDVLVSGNHKDLEAWRKRTAEQMTKKKRPDLFKRNKKSGPKRTRQGSQKKTTSGKD